MKVTGLWVYPVKSLRGAPVDLLRVGERGPAWDRHWMLVDAHGKFLTQRTRPLLARLTPSLTDSSLSLEGPGLQRLSVPLAADEGRRAVTVWRDTFDAIDCGEEAARWLSAFVSEPCRLVRMADEVRRPLDPKYSPRPDAHTAFADAYPLLGVNEASLDELNGRLATAVPMDRFRANLIVRGDAPWEEDRWRALKVGSLTLDAVKPCARCVVITTDQRTGERASEPLATLTTYRLQEPFGVVFGQNLVPRAPGVLQVGDAVEVLC
jgi:uncharacterized protein YcbX